MIVLGSKALHINLNNDPERFNRSDIDVVMSMDEFSAFITKNKPFMKKMAPTSANKYSVRLKNTRAQHYEIEIAFKGSSKWLLENEQHIAAGQFEDDCGNVFVVANTDILYATKKSHIHYAIHYDKNMADYTLLKGVANSDALERYKEYYDLRCQEIKDRVSKKPPKLNRTNKEFFDRSQNVVGYVFVHDDIHEAIKHYDRPVYEMMKTDFSKAWCEKDMFHNLPHLYKIRCVQEEAYVIALERYIVLRKGNFDNPQLAYKAALQRICTTLCSGFFRDFAVEHYYEILNAYDNSYVDTFKNKVAQGLVNKLEHVTQERYDEVIEQLQAA